MKLAWTEAVLMLAWLMVAGGSAAQQEGLVPMNPQPRTDQQGNEWYVEQNGMLSRQGGGRSILSGAMMLMVGPEQFYCHQPMGTPDGREAVLTSPQPMAGGLTVTRQIRFLEKEGGIRYVESFANNTAADISTTVEIRSNFSGQVKNLVTDLGRVNSGSLQKGESGMVVLPSGGNFNAWLFTVCAPKSAVKPRVASVNQYQMSFFFPLTVPAGRSISLLHTATQAKLPLRPDAEDMARVLKPFALSRQMKDLPKGVVRGLVNVRSGASAAGDLAGWFPDAILDIPRGAVDVLAMGEGTRLHGRAMCASLTLDHRFGTVALEWDKVVALSGGRHGSGTSRIWLADGQVLEGRLKAQELKFVLTSGLSMALEIDKLDRLVRAGTGAAVWPDKVSALVETWQGERLALREGAALQLQAQTVWGGGSWDLKDIAAWAPAEEEGSEAALLVLKDGSRLRAWWGGAGSQRWPTVLFGDREIAGSMVRAMVVAPEQNQPEEELENEPAVNFAELAGEQRLVASMASPLLHVVTEAGVVPLELGSLREMRNITEETGPAEVGEAPWFQMDLWGGGSLRGQLQEVVLPFAVGSETWMVPAREVLRVRHPVPRIAEATLTRIGELLRDLGHDDWRRREGATEELKSLGELARGSLQEAFNQTEDEEVKRRIQSILGEVD